MAEKKEFTAETSGRIPDWSYPPAAGTRTLHISGSRASGMVEIAIEHREEPDWLTDASVVVDLDELAVMVRAIREVRSE